MKNTGSKHARPRSYGSKIHIKADSDLGLYHVCLTSKQNWPLNSVDPERNYLSLRRQKPCLQNDRPELIYKAANLNISLSEAILSLARHLLIHPPSLMQTYNCKNKPV